MLDWRSNVRAASSGKLNQRSVYMLAVAVCAEQFEDSNVNVLHERTTGRQMCG